MAVNIWQNVIPWRKFFQHFPSVKALRTEGANNYRIASTLFHSHEDSDDLPLLLALKQIELGKYTFSTHESQYEPELAAFEPFVSARRQSGRPVKSVLRSVLVLSESRMNEFGSGHDRSNFVI